MSYAVNINTNGWRAVDSLEDCSIDEYFSLNQPEPIGQSKEYRIELIQSIYESHMDKLNKAWLSSLISNGDGQSARQSSIKTQMSSLNESLDADILVILMEP